MSGTKTRLLIKLVIGRALLDTAESGHRFELEEAGRGWTITVYGMSAADAAFIGDNIGQLNFFHFVTALDESAAIQKYWLYDLDEPLFRYDRATGTAVFELDSKVAYTNERV
ncbi:hypothetical protein [Paenibacillus beijingensis]|uniref:Uncharacterized protein n=1 Tax=Paenibacillus beijingensis TaxID=1126833 RepID=A0A0D5NK93_9BACL|nr:hypothetical protein [Paenibacillus beijingensis]AJY75651.1 hypothetical protein VN24_15140 [Paenibacillus beijingensis]